MNDEHAEMTREKMHQRTLFVVNPASGGGDHGQVEKQIVEFAREAGIPYRVIRMDRENDDLKLRNQILEYNPGTVVACGGDGTVNFVAGHLLGKGIRLGILPLGSFNGLAYQMGIPSDVSKALQVLLKGKVKPIDAIRVSKEHICLHLSDLGTNARVIKRHEAGRMKGFTGYLIQYFKELGRTRKFKCRIRTEEEDINTKAVMVILANARYYGTGVSVNPAADMSDGRFEVIVIRSYPFWFLFYIIINLLSGRTMKDRWTNIISCSEARIELHPAQELQVDGEWAGLKQTIEPSAGENKIGVIC